MSLVFRRSRGLIPAAKTSARYVSSATATFSEDIYQDTTTTKVQTNIRQSSTGNALAQTVKEVLVNVQSSSFLKSSVPDKVFATGTFNPHSVSHQLYRFAQEQQYDMLLKAFLKWTSTSVGLESLQLVLTKEQISYFIKLLIDHQKTLIVNMLNINRSNRLTRAMDNAKSKEKHYRNSIRNIYSNLIYGPKSGPEGFIYHRTKRGDLYNSSHLTGYRLTVPDYENLILHELTCNKLDLASKWFERFEAEFGSQSRELMTDRMWMYKFLVLGGGKAPHWQVKDSEYYVRKTKSTPYVLKTQQKWLEVYADYVEQRGSPNDPRITEQLIYSMGYAENTEFLTQYIESVWGIAYNGVPTKPAELRGDPLYPNLDILQAIVVSLSYNHKFFQAMSYINAFQEVYGGKEFDLSRHDALPFWKTIFHWADQCTRFNEQRALQHYLKGTSVDIKSVRSEDLIKSAQQDVDFEYEKYLTFIDELKSKRSNTLEEIWKLFTSTNTHFSPKIFEVRLMTAQETRSEEKFYGLMEALAERYHYYETSPTSFNRRSNSSPLAQLHKSAETLYLKTLQAFVDIKGFDGYIGQCEPLIQEWSLNEKMKVKMDTFLGERMLKYRSTLEKRREEKMIEQRTENEDEGLLDLF